MPKKFKGENSKAVEARARRDAKHQAEKAQKEKEKEDALWQDDDKHIAKKQQRKEDKDKKRQEQQEKKQQLKQLYDEEMAQMKVKPAAQPKLSRAELAVNRERLAAAAAADAVKKPTLSHDEVPLEENMNQVVPEGEEARSVEEAISLLSTKDPELEKHPEKRVKAAYLKFETENLPVLKQENPNMRLSQLKQLLKKDWMKSPENPLNQRYIAYNAK